MTKAILRNHTAATPIKPIERSIHVAAEPARAFNIFTSHVRDWWDPAVFSARKDASFVDLVIEPCQGGRWFAPASDGSDREWGRVQEFEAPSRLVVDWHPHGVSLRMELTFTGPAPQRTEVRTALSGFEGFGADAAKMRDIHNSKWASLLDGFAVFVAQYSQATQDDLKAK